MASLRNLSRRDRRWGEDGPAARREQQRRRAREVAAFLMSLLAAVAAGAVLAFRLSATVLHQG